MTMRRKITNARWLEIAAALVICGTSAQSAALQDWQKDCAYNGKIASVIHCEVAYGGHNFDQTPVQSNGVVACGKGRVWNPQTHQCRGPADIDR